MKSKKIIWSVVALLAAAAILVGAYFLFRPQADSGAKTITVTVIHGDGTEKDFVCHTDRVYLGQVLTDEKLVEGTDTEYGLMIHTVDGEKASWEEDNAYWALYVGDEYALTGADSTPVADGDRFKLVYTQG